MHPMDEEQQIRELTYRWAAAVYAGDLDRVLADHSADIVMSDVLSPFEGVRGIQAYCDTCPPFFDWQAHGASFQIATLDITVGVDVAYAHALLLGTPQDLTDNPEQRLRLTWDYQGTRALGRPPRTPLIPRHRGAARPRRHRSTLYVPSAVVHRATARNPWRVGAT